MNGKIGYDEWMPMKHEIDGDRSTGSASVAEWKIEATCVAVGMEGSYHVEYEECERGVRENDSRFESKPSRGLKKGSAACRWMDGTCRCQ